MWVICKATLGKGKNKLLVRGTGGMEWVFCPLIKSIKRDRVTVDRCQGCKYFVCLQQTRITLTHTTRKHLSFGSRVLLKGTSRVARPLGWLRASNKAKPSPLPWMVGAIKEREPIIDIFEEEDHVIVVTELPHANEKDINIKMEESSLTISAKNAMRTYLKKLVLPTPVRKDTVKSTFKNNILEVRLEKARSKA